jgi:hypothetical protein
MREREVGFGLEGILLYKHLIEFGPLACEIYGSQ